MLILKHNAVALLHKLMKLKYLRNVRINYAELYNLPANGFRTKL